MLVILETLMGLAVLVLLYLGLVKLIKWIRYWLFPTEHELEIRLNKTLEKEEALERKQELKESLINATKRVKSLEKADAKKDAELAKVCESNGKVYKANGEPAMSHEEIFEKFGGEPASKYGVKTDRNKSTGGGII